ncbi:flagellar motor protein MotD [Aerolutibacter ruishenii]|uniref:Chemotaxis protein MotB n=1 Tax=Aerolutibacter ruishenii TaxID=686800 RepID=A0A562LK74_9GAMM|nr:flagellar motor protein MotD [Lysobacter ruishenii]TWI08005.1 chemotaxis protein MotB [Lysobacter ruishenii]
MGSRHKRHQHEEHASHEAWAIPYGDLLTLLLAFFVVMYAISSINEGKYRVLSDALSSAFGGPPRTISPIQLGHTQLRGSSFDRPSLQTPGTRAGPSSASPIASPSRLQVLDLPTFAAVSRMQQDAAASGATGKRVELERLGTRIRLALRELVKLRLVKVRESETFVEVEIQSDILFQSGSAAPSAVAIATVRELAGVLAPEPNAVRVEGYTDNLPIRSVQFPSNWELSAARAASVTHELIGNGVVPHRLAVVGYGEYQPVADNATPEGRNANRRVTLVILASPQGPDTPDATTPAPSPTRTAAAEAEAADASAPHPPEVG